MAFTRTKILAYSSVAAVSLFPVAVLAALGGVSGSGRSGGGAGGGTIPNPLGETTSIGILLGKFIDVLVQVGLVVIVLAFIYAGFLFVTALGDEGKVKEARSMFYGTVIGAAILLGARVIATAIQTTIERL